MINSQAQKVVLVTPPAAIVDNASYATTEIDTKGFNYLTILVALGATDVALAAMKLTESDEAGSGHADISGATFAGSLPGATDDNKVYAFHVDLLGRKRYIDLVLTGGDGTTGAYATVMAVLSRGERTPRTATERGLAAELFV